VTERLRVAVDATPLLGPRTGVGVFTAELLAHLPLGQVAPVAYATSWRGRGQLATLVPSGVEVASRPQAARPLRMLWRRADLPPIEWWTGPVDVVHGPNYVVPPSRHAAQVMTIHDLTFHHHPEMSTADTLQYPDLIDRALRRGAWVHTESHFVAGEIIDAFGADPERVVVVPLGVSALPEADPDRGRQLAGSQRYVVAVGTVEPRKDLPLLIDAFEGLAAGEPDLRLVIAGPDGWGAEALADRIARSEHRSRIVRLGWVSDEDRSALVRGAAALAYPSRYEGFGLPPLEAMSVGTPVVATAVGALPEVLGQAALLVPPRDSDALAAALSSLLAGGDEHGRSVERGREQAARYSWAACADGLVELYRQAAEHPR
jgi:glycosyltransferase involved in cell wall biosynthesis